MTSKIKFLRYSIVGLIFFGIVLASIPFIGSLKPSARATALGTPIDISDQEPGTVEEYETRWGHAFVVYRPGEDVVVFHVSGNEHVYMLPDEKWYRAFIPCEDFGFEPQHGLITEESVFRCRQAQYGEWWESELVWTIEGRSLGQYTEDMPPAPYERYGDKLVIDPWKQLQPNL